MTITGRRATTGHDTRQPSDLLAAFLAVIAQAPHWPDRACRGEDPRLWDDRLDLPDCDGQRPAREPETERNARHDTALAICGHCPWKADCHARRTTDPTLGPGIWGGELFTPDQRAARCAQCRSLFTRRASEKYCGEDCRRVAHRAQRAAYETRGRTSPTRCQAPGCGTPLTPERQKQHAHYCDGRCKRKAERAARRKATLPPPPIQCVICNATVPANRQARGAKTCTREHGAEHRRRSTAAAMTAARAKPLPVPGLTHCANPACGNALTGPQRNHGTATCSPGCRTAVRAASTPTGREVTAA